MRKGYDGLAGIVRNELEADPVSGAVYVFFSKDHKSVKLLCWDKDGFAIYSKRLEKGYFEQMAAVIEGKSKEIAYEYLIMLLSGISLLGHKKKPRYLLTKNAS